MSTLLVFDLFTAAFLTRILYDAVSWQSALSLLCTFTSSLSSFSYYDFFCSLRIDACCTVLCRWCTEPVYLMVWGIMTEMAVWDVLAVLSLHI